MSTTLAESPTEPRKASALAVMANRVSVDPAKLLTTLKDTVFKGASESELIALVVVANEYNLNPFLKEIYAFPAKGGGITPIVSVDGWIKMINRQPGLDGITFSFDADGGECTCRIYIRDRQHPVEVTEYKSECYRGTEPWKQMPRRMLRHKALIQAARVAFGFSGIYDEDEARDIANIKVEAAKPVFELPGAPASTTAESAAPSADEPPETPEFTASTPQKTLLAQLADAGITEAEFFAYQKEAFGFKRAKTVLSLTDAEAEEALFGFAEAVGAIRGGDQRP